MVRSKKIFSNFSNGRWRIPSIFIKLRKLKKHFRAW